MAIIGRKCHVGRAEVQNEHQLIIKIKIKIKWASIVAVNDKAFNRSLKRIPRINDPVDYWAAKAIAWVELGPC